MLNISFGAKFLSNENVFKYKKCNKSYSSDVISFIEIDSNNLKDVLAVQDAVNSWFYDSYACCILMTLRAMYKKFENSQNYKIFALTSQKNNYDTLESNKIMGLAQMMLKKGEIPYLNYLQVNPDYIKQYDVSGNREYKGVGKAILRALQKVYDSILLKAANSGLDYFYKTNSFSLIDKAYKMYYWKK